MWLFVTCRLHRRWASGMPLCCILLEHDSLLKPCMGNQQVPLSLSLGPLTTLSAGLGQAPRLGKGISYRPSKKPEKPIELWVRPLTLTSSGPAVVLPCGLSGDNCQAGVAMPAPSGAATWPWPLAVMSIASGDIWWPIASAVAAGLRGQPLLLANAGGADRAGDPAHLQVPYGHVMLHLRAPQMSVSLN